MKINKFLAAVCMAFFAQLASADTPRASIKQAQIDPLYKETLLDIKKTLGAVPDMFSQFPDQSLPSAWQTFKAVQLGANTAIPCKYKELIGLAVSAQIPCHYCTYFHTEAAGLNGAKQNEIREAVALAAVERQWSTFFHGTQTDYEDFKKWTDAAMTKVKADSQSAEPANSMVSNKPFATAEEAYADIEKTFGSVPDFVKKYPKAGLAGAWSEIKTLTFNPHTSIPSKYKDLISLAVSAQVPCQYCIYFDTAAARVDGASEDEINEAVAMASQTRHWSTVLNGLQTNDAVFKAQLAQVLNYVKKQMAASAQPEAKKAL